MKVKVSIPVALMLTIATLGFSQSLIVAKTATPSPQVNKQQLSEDEAEAMQRVNALVQEGNSNLEKAIAIVEGLLRDGSRTVALFQKLGDLYQQAGRDPKYPEAAYAKALELATAAGNVPAQAQAQVALAKVKLTLGKNAEARTLLSQAQAAYQALGDTKQASELQQQIATLPNNANNSGNLPNSVFRGASDSTACKSVKPKPPVTLNKQLCDLFGLCAVPCNPTSQP